jgi:hypothetical protein
VHPAFEIPSTFRRFVILLALILPPAVFLVSLQNDYSWETGLVFAGPLLVALVCAAADVIRSRIVMDENGID